MRTRRELADRLLDGLVRRFLTRLTFFVTSGKRNVLVAEGVKCRGSARARDSSRARARARPRYT